MATTAQTLIDRVRSYLRDWPAITDVLAGDVTTSSWPSIQVADSSIYTLNRVIQVDAEAMLVAALADSTTVTVRRGQRGTTAATHATGAAVLLRPNFLDQEILDAINDGIDACWPYVYKEVTDTSLTVVTNQYEYAVPSLPSTNTPIPRIWKVETKTPGDAAYRRVTDWQIVKGATPTLKFRSVPYPGSTLRINGYGPFSHLASGDSTDALWPMTANPLLVQYAASTLLASGEAGRVRQSSGAVDDREQANRVGSSTAAGRDTFQRFKDALLNGAHCPPMMAHLVVTY